MPSNVTHDAEFASGLAEHLAAISARDSAAFAATVSRDPQVRVIGPDGVATVGYEAITSAHRDWFGSDAAWTFEPTVVMQRSSGDLGFALLDVLYREGPAARRFLLALVFTHEDERWKLLYDQNTALENG